MNNSQEIQGCNSHRGFEMLLKNNFENPAQIIVPKVIRSLKKSIEQTNKRNSNFFEQGLNELLITLEKKLEIEKITLSIQKYKEINKASFLNRENLIEHLCEGFSNQPFKLVFHDDLPFPAYKDIFFTLRGNIVDKTNKIASLNEPMLFSAILYGAQLPIKAIEKTKYNEKIIVGNSVIETISAINFRRIALKEVSSIHSSKMFNLVIVPEDIKMVEPFVFPGLVVKSAKLRPSEIRKKFKVDEFMKHVENS